jgi:Tfp pilus assembly protein PilP
MPAPASAPVATPSASVPSPAGAEAPRLVPHAPELTNPAVPNYEVRGRRDPFTVLDVVSGPSGLTIASTKLTGIVFSGQSALALVETSDGIGYILKPGDTLGDGRLMEVGADTAVFAVAARPGAPVNRVVLRLAAN